METESTTAPIPPKQLSFKNLKDEEQGTYILQRTNDPYCIYRMLEIPETLFIKLDISKEWERNTFGYYTGGGNYKNTANMELYDSVHYAHMLNVQHYKKATLNVLSDTPAPTGKIHDYWNNFIVYGGYKINVSNIIRNNKKDFEIYEQNGQYYIDILNVKFPVAEFVKSSRASGPAPIFALETVSGLPGKFSTPKLRSSYIRSIIDPTAQLRIEKEEGIQKTLTAVLPFYKAALNDITYDVFNLFGFYLAAKGAKRTLNNVKFSVAFNKIFTGITSQKQFDDKLIEIAKTLDTQTSFYDGARSFLEKLLDELPDAREVKKAALKRKQSGSFNKIMDDLDFVKINPETHPLTHEAVHSGTIPLGTFFRKTGESYFVYNDNWDLWEEMLAQFPDIAQEISAEASRRTTYEKDIMSYFMFVLHTLPEYLEKQTGKAWKGIPKLVSSSNELDPPTEGSNGVAKTRSALTPIVDNENNTVVVPYVSMAIAGYSTTYCYGLDFNVLDKGFSLKGNAISKSVEKKLNGRDDYGLMFYTLTGSSQGRGYPTFLIIFERLENSTTVHFHRTHPMRSKSGDYNPVHAWTIGCYKWMIGNVNFDRIKAQQGDLAFVEMENSPFDYADGDESLSSEVSKAITNVNSYDSHCFGKSVEFLPYTKKDNQNVLGYVRLKEPTLLSHTHHMNRVIPAGSYEIRQCRSWEANPKGVWSLRID